MPDKIKCRKLENAGFFEGIREEEVCIADIPALPIHPDDLSVDEDIVADQSCQAFEVARTDSSIEEMH